MKWEDIKYLLAYLGPASAYLAVGLSQLWSFSTVILTFVIIPVLELLLPVREQNLASETYLSRGKEQFFNLLLYVHVPVLYALIAFYLWRITTYSLGIYELIGMTLSVGIVVGSSGINVGHELGHRSEKFEQTLAKLLLLPALYLHFYIEHNRGHHRNVATPEDPATARYSEWIFTFWCRSIWNSYLHAWILERKQLEKHAWPFFSKQNQMIRFTFYQLFYLILIYLITGLTGFIGTLLIALIGILLLESINYIEHYGLMRKKIDTGRYEKVGMEHSWNSNHEIGRIFLYELTRHADHHYKASKKYQTLEHIQNSPQLPMGYPGAIILSLFPPLWFRLMDPRIPRLMLPDQ